MEIPLNNPNLPDSRVTVVAVSGCCEALNKKLKELKIEVIETVNNKNINVISNHTDLSMLNISKGIIYIDESQRSNIVNFLTKGYEVKVLKNKITSPYPRDCGLNCVFIGDKVILNKKSACKEVYEYVVNNNNKIIYVNQGYTKCSVSLINDKALITDDESIYEACYYNEIDSILISKGSIKLKGFDYGFIGGCTGLIDKNKILFNGDINYHKDCNKILDFLDKYKIEPVIIENEPLSDIGSIIPICEKKTILYKN